MRSLFTAEFKRENLTAPQGMIMGILSHRGEMKVSDISKVINLSNSTVSGILDRLEKMGYVQRKRSEKDRRVVYISITPEFSKLAKERSVRIEKNMEKVVEKASDEELDKIIEGLTILDKILNEWS